MYIETNGNSADLRCIELTPNESDLKIIFCKAHVWKFILGTSLNAKHLTNFASNSSSYY